jgi:hypothetical protein
MNPVRKALAVALKGDKALAALATGGIFHRLAGRGAVPPYVIFNKMSGVPAWTFAGPPMDKDVWLVKAVGQDRDVCEDIDRRCREILNGADLAIEGKAHQDLRHIADVDIDEVVEGERYNHVGAEYKLDSEDE